MTASNQGRLAGRTALVTGAGNGIGQACAMALGAAGANVVVNDLGTSEFGHGESRGPAADTAAAISALGTDSRAVADHHSVATSDGCAAAVQMAIDSFGQLDIVVACAGALLNGSLDATDDQYRSFVDLFLSQKFWLARAAVPAMAERGWGRLITTTSHGATGFLGQPIFAASMGGVISMTKAIAHEYAASGVTANCLAPGAATRLHALSRTNFENMHAQGLISDEDWDNYVNTPPPEYVGPIVAWLCTDKANGVTGQVFHANGGTVGVWNAYEEKRAAFRGDHREHPPWTLAELDSIVPKMLLA